MRVFSVFSIFPDCNGKAHGRARMYVDNKMPKDLVCFDNTVGENLYLATTKEVVLALFRHKHL